MLLAVLVLFLRAESSWQRVGQQGHVVRVRARTLSTWLASADSVS